MDQIEAKICAILQEMTDCNIQSLVEMKDGFLLSNLFTCINAEFFPNYKMLKDWYSAQDKLQEFLNCNGLDEILDFDIEEIQRGHKESLISAIFQILAIYAVFNPKGWEKTINSVEYDTKYSVMMILQKMINKIQFELSIAQQELNPPSQTGSNEFKQLLQKLEFQEGILNQNQTELLEKTNTIFSLQKEVQKVKGDLVKKSKQFNEDKKRKEETIKYLEQMYGPKKDEETIKRYEGMIKDMENEKEVLSNANRKLEAMVDERDSELEKLKVLKEMTETRQKEFEVVNEQLGYYKKLVEKLKKESELNFAKSQILTRADQNVKELQIELEREKGKSIIISRSKSVLEGEIESLRRKFDLANDNLDYIKRKSCIKPTSNDFNLKGNYISEIEDSNTDLTKKLDDAMEEISYSYVQRFNTGLDSELTYEDLQSQVKSLRLEKDALQKENNFLLKQQSTTDLNLNKIDSLQNIQEVDEEHEKMSSNNSGLKQLKANNILSKGTISEFYDGTKNPDEFYDIFYSLSVNAMKEAMMNQKLMIPGRFERKRDIFSRFTFSSVLNK